MKKILMIGTGGTISCEAGNNGLAPAKLAEELLKYCPKVKEICDVECIQVINIDSTNMRPGHWLMIEEVIQKNYDKYDGFVITHGTDTLSYTAAAISYLVQNSKKPIVITGAQVPISEPGTDAIKNVTDAFIVAADDESHGVMVVFCGKVILGTRARKNFTKQ
ncbi:MAG: asparaginase, partial [Lachnospiraceae bacterium]|nr:asparaginase [Lachnospiraceae bacterium]